MAQLTFFSNSHLAKWLREHPLGRQILGDAIAERTAGRDPVLVILHGDGWVEVYGYRDLSVTMIQRPTTTVAANALLVDEWIGAQLRPSHRALYWPNRLVAADKCRKVMALDLLDSGWQLELLAALNHNTRNTNDE